MITGELQSLPEVFQRLLVQSFLDIRRGQTEIAFSQSAPIAAQAVTLQCAMRVVPGDWILADAAIDTRQRSVNSACFSALFRQIPLRGFQESHGLWMIAVVVVSKSDLYAQPGT